MGRIAGIDFGEKRIGIAISDPSKIIASPVKMIPTESSLKKTALAILPELEIYQPLEGIVLGLPLHMDGKESITSARVRELKTYLEEFTTVPIILWDERLTTAQVERTLKEAQIARKKRGLYIDAMAAGAILQSYLDRLLC